MRRGGRHADTHGADGHTGTQGADGRRHAQGRGLGGTRPARTWILQDGEKTRSSLLLKSHPACGTLLWLPWQNNRIIFSGGRIVSGPCRICSSLPCLQRLSAICHTDIPPICLIINPCISPIDLATIYPSIRASFYLSTSISASIHTSCVYPFI